MIPRFRAWDVNKKKMFTNEELVIWNNKVYAYDKAKLTHNNQINLIIDEEYIMQSTGLEDKNGQEIFEGDIVIDYQGTFFEVKRADGYAGFFLYPYDPEDSMTFYPEIELTIIGNIYEDSGLMEV